MTFSLTAGPGGVGWYTWTFNNITTYMACQNAVVACPNTANLNVTFGFLNPAAVNGTGVSQPLGTIVYFTGDTGTAPGSTDYNDYYFQNGYEVVELAWADDWEMTYDPMGSNTPSIQNAACRPATLLNYIYTTLFVNGVQLSNSSAAMCAQGQSAGSGAVAYSLAYYGANGYLDNVELLSGPVFADIKQGCEVPSANPVTVCGQTNYNGGQFGCNLGQGGSTWTLSPTYLTGANTQVQKWTNDATCAAGSTTSGGSNSKWLAQSIVDQSTGAIPTFNYSATGMSAWLCRSVVDLGYNCAVSGTGQFNNCPNNSSPQGQISYANIGASNPPPSYTVYAVDNCDTAEGVVAGNVPGYQPLIFNGTVQGFDAIKWDMAGLKNPDGSTKIPALCVQRHNH